MRPALRLVAVVLGLATALYGTASLTGGWLGTPPWWEAWTSWQRPTWDQKSDPEDVRFTSKGLEYRKPGQDREWISIGVVAAGVGLLALGGGPKRRRASAAP